MTFRTISFAAAGFAAILPTGAQAACFGISGNCYYVATVAGADIGSQRDNHLDGPTHSRSEVNVSQGTPAIFVRAGAASDLASGALRARIDTNYGGDASAQFFERFKFALPAGVTETTAPVMWVLEGSTQFINGSPNGMGARFSISHGAGGDDVLFDDLNFNYTNPKYKEFVSNGFHRFVFSGLLHINASDLYSIQAALSLGVSGGAILDYGDTAFVNIDLPPGVSLISSSGVLLSRPVQPGVPEPATWAMMLGGFALAGAAARKRRWVLNV